MSATLPFAAAAAPARRADRATITGRVISALMVALLALDGTMKLVATDMMIANSPAGILPPEPALYQALGVVLLVSTLLYALPRTAVLGAVLLTGYLGGAVAIHVRMADPLFSQTLVGAYLGIAMWAGLWLRDPRVRALLPLRAGAER